MIRGTFIYCDLFLITVTGLSCHTSQPSTIDHAIDASQIIPQTATVDKFGNLYYANRQQEIFKMDHDGVQQGYYSNNRLGNVHSIDVTNPLKILLYFPDFFTGITLDRQLNETSSFNMIDLGFGQVALVASSLDGALWIFDDHSQRLNKVDQQGRILREGQDLRLLFNERFRPAKIMEADGQLFLLVPARGLLIFDLFGQYKSQILEAGMDDFQMVNSHLVYRKGNILYQYGLDTHVSREIFRWDGAEGIKLLWAKEEQWYVVGPQGVELTTTSKH